MTEKEKRKEFKKMMFRCNTTVTILRREKISDGQESFRERETPALARETAARNRSDFSGSEDSVELLLPPDCVITLDDAIRWNERIYRPESISPRRDVAGTLCAVVCRMLG